MQRYCLASPAWIKEPCGCDMVDIDSGDWVRFEDVQALARECLKAVNVANNQTLYEYQSLANQLRAIVGSAEGGK